MSGPWDDYGAAPAETTAGPWADYAAPVPPRPVGAAMAVGSGMPQIGPGPRTSQMPDPPMPWGDVASGAARNFLPSLGRAGESVYNAFRHPLDTATNAGRLVGGVMAQGRDPEMMAANNMQAITDPVGAKAFTDAQDAYAKEARVVPDAVGQDFANAYGGLENFKATLASDPIRPLMDLSTFSPLAAETLPGKVGMAVGAAGRAIDPVTVAGNALKLPTKYIAEPIAASTLGMTTGAGTRSIRDAGSAGRALGSGIDMADGFVGKTGPTLENAKAITDNMNRGAPIQGVVDRFKGALDAVRQEAGDAYRKGMRDLGKDLQPMDFQPIEDAVNKASEVGAFKGVSVEPAATETVAKMSAIVNDWKALDPADYHTPVGIDALKRSLGNIRDSTPYGSPERVAANRVYNGVRAELTTRAPEYAKTMEGYGNAADQVGEASAALSLGPKASTDTAARKILSATRNNVQTNFGERARIVDMLAQKDSTLPYAIAGQALQSPLPRGVIARGGAMAYAPAIAAAIFHNPVTALAGIPAMAAASPRIVGNVVYYGGRAVGTVDDIAKAMRITPDAVRAAERGGYQAGQNDKTANRGLEVYRQRQALQGNPYMQMGGP